MSLSIRWIALCAGIATVAACGASVHLKGPRTTGEDATGIRQPGIGSAVARSNAIGAAAVRRTCRGTRPSGFIAIDYTASDSTVCPSAPTKRSLYGVALVIPYDNIQVGEEISVCADQAVPAGWYRVRLD